MGGHGGDNSLKSVMVAVSVNAFITVAKFVGWAMTWSPALLAEAIHSAADVGNQVLLWVGIRQSEKAATPEHPYGWGHARYLWNLKSAMGIFFLGCGVTMFHGGHSLLEWLRGHGHAPDASWWGLGILGLAFVLEGYSLLVAIKGINADRGERPFLDYLKQSDDPTGVGVLLEDLAAVTGVLIALVGVALSQWLHSPLPDAISTLLIGALMGWLAFFLAKTNGRLLIGHSDREVEAKIRAALEADELVEKVEDLKTEILGAGRIRVKCEIDLYEKLVARHMMESLRDDCDKLRQGTEPMKVLVDVVGRSVRIAGHEIRRLEGVIHEVAPQAAHIDLELI